MIQPKFILRDAQDRNSFQAIWECEPCRRTIRFQDRSFLMAFPRSVFSLVMQKGDGFYSAYTLVRATSLEPLPDDIEDALETNVGYSGPVMLKTICVATAGPAPAPSVPLYGTTIPQICSNAVDSISGRAFDYEWERLGATQEDFLPMILAGQSNDWKTRVGELRCKAFPLKYLVPSKRPELVE